MAAFAFGFMGAKCKMIDWRNIISKNSCFFRLHIGSTYVNSKNLNTCEKFVNMAKQTFLAEGFFTLVTALNLVYLLSHFTIITKVKAQETR